MDNTYILTSDGELYHWGVKGMKWGVRRYQNKDGSLTEAGKKRLSENAGRYLAYNSTEKNHSNRNAAVRKYYEDHRVKDDTSGKLESYINEYSKATLKDLKMKDSDEARAYLNNLFNNDPRVQEFRDNENRVEARRKSAEDELKRMSKEDHAQVSRFVNSYTTDYPGTPYEMYRSKSKVKIGGTDVELHITSNKGDETIDAIAANKFLKRYDLVKAKDGVIKEYYDSPDSWINDPNAEWYVTREDFASKIRPMVINLTPADRTYEVWWDDGDTYGGHAFTDEGSMDDMKVRGRSLNG